MNGVTITSEPVSDSTYLLGERIEVEVTFTRPVTVTGAPQLALTVGAATRQAGYADGTGTNALTFGYTVAASDADSDGLSIGASALVLNGGAINDVRPGAAAANLGLGSNAIPDAGAHRVDGSGPPSVTAVSIASPVVGDTFERGETIEVEVTFNKAVDVTGTPQLALTIGSTARQASYASGAGTASLVFRYLVVQTDADADGISISAGALALNGGTIDVAGGTLDAALGLGGHAISNSAGHKVAGGTFTASSVSGVTISSKPSGDSTYSRTERIEVEVTFTRPVTVTGAPQLALTIGRTGGRADYASGTGTSALMFRYTVQAADRDTDGLSIGASALALNGGAINDARPGAAAASLGLGANAISNAAAHKVDGSRGPPVASGLSISSPVVGDTFERGETIEVMVTFNKAVDVTGTPQLALTIGSLTRQASYASGTGTTSLVFRYVVVRTDADANGISIGSSALALNGGTIDMAGGTLDAVLGLGAHAISNSAGHKVAGGTFTRPSVNGVTITSEPASDSTYLLGERIEVEVTFTRPVMVTGAPQLTLAIGGARPPADYASGTGTNALMFQYTVQAADRDTDGLSIGWSALALNGGAINDVRSGAAAASLGLGANAISDALAHQVNGSVPVVSAVSIASPVVGDTFERGETIEVTVTFNKAVDVTGTPQLTLAIGSTTKQALYASGTGTASLVFRYLVVMADADADGISIGVDALVLNGGTIDVAGGTLHAALGLGAHTVSNSAGHKVAGGTFTASSVNGVTITSEPASDSTYLLGERIEVEVTFTRPVRVTGAPQLTLTIGRTGSRADYASGTGTNALTFRYAVQATDRDTDGLSIGASALALNGGAINDARPGAAAASLGLGANAISNAAAHKVDGSRGP